MFDAESGILLGGESVYLANNTLGDATAGSGEYKIRNIPPGNYNLVYCFIGYEQVVKNIDIGPSDSLVIDTGLTYTQYELDSLVVKQDRDRRWERLLERF